MKISYEEFFDCISKIIVHYEKLNRYSKILSFDFIQDLQEVSDQLEFVLIKLCNDEEGGWINYWLWELDFGKKYYEGSIVDENNEFVRLETIKDLWNLLEKNYCSNDKI